MGDYAYLKRPSKLKLAHQFGDIMVRVGIDPKPHLGGFIHGGDSRTFCSRVWEWALSRFNVKSMVDIGCGEGHSTCWWSDHGCRVLGIEGSSLALVNSPRPFLIRQHDYCNGPLILEDRFDLAWSCEFVEHVEERFSGNFLATFQSAAIVMMTHAFPNQDGYHHVNCQKPEYWINRMKEFGFSFNSEDTAFSRTIQPDTYFGKSGLIFRKSLLML